MKTILFLSSLFYCSSLFAQVGASLSTSAFTPYSGDHILNQILDSDSKRYSVVDGYKVTGSPFYKEKYFESNLTLANKIVVKTAVFYNLYDQKLYSIAGGKVVGSIEDKIIRFTYEEAGNTFEFINADSFAVVKKGFFKTLFSNDSITLYEYNYSIMVNDDVSLTKDFKIYDPKSEYYVVVGKNKIEKIKFNKKNLTAIFGEKAKAIFAKANELDLLIKNAEELTLILFSLNKN